MVILFESFSLLSIKKYCFVLPIKIFESLVLIEVSLKCNVILDFVKVFSLAWAVYKMKNAYTSTDKQIINIAFSTFFLLNLFNKKGKAKSAIEIFRKVKKRRGILRV